MENDDKKTISDAPTQASATHSSSNNPLDRKLSSLPQNSPEYSPARSSVSSDPSSLSHGLSPTEEKFQAYPPENPPGQVPERSPSPVAMVNRYVREEPAVVTKADLGAVSVEAGGGGGGGGGGWSGRKLRPPLSTLRRTKRESMLKTTALGFRVCGFLFCLISFSVMAADKNQGWAVDSFDRYKEFRYCMSVNVIGFVYSGAQAFDLAVNLATGKSFVRHQFRYYFDFAIDQLVAYLLISASSSAATRVEDWESNWGKDKFPEMATASVAVSFVAFVALAFSSLVSGYSLYIFKST